MKRFLMAVALVLIAIALYCAIATTTVAGADGLTWFFASITTLVVDKVLDAFGKNSP